MTDSTRSEVRDGMRTDWDVPLAMDDGVVLRADVFRPLVDRPCPVILSYGPYAKGLAFQEGYPSAWQRMVAEHPDVACGSSNKYQSWEVVDPEKWVPDGYACVRVDSRGAGRSPGYIDPFSPRETQDFYQCIEWAGVQPWSNGKVGLNGISYYGINQWQVASLQPPHLAALCVWEGAADWYRDMTHHGGILSTFWANWFDMQVKTVQYGLGARGPRSRVTGELVCGDVTLSDQELYANRADFGAEVLAHPLDDDYHKARSPAWGKITVPLLSAANWGGQGLHPRGNFEGYLRAASKHKWLEVHGIEHWTHFYTDYGVKLQKRFFDHFLKSADNGWSAQPRVQLQVRHVPLTYSEMVDRPSPLDVPLSLAGEGLGVRDRAGMHFKPDGFAERHENEWPLARTQWTKFYLNCADDSLVREPPEAAGQITYDARSEGVTFISPPLGAETEITGPLAARLCVSSTTTDADFFLVFRVFTPDLREVVFMGAIDPHTPVAQGWLRASHRKLDSALSTPYRPYHTHDELQPLTPGAVVTLDVELWPTSIVVPAGYRVALTVRGRDYEYAKSTGARLSNFKNELRGCGPFLHDDPRDRPAAVFGGDNTLHFGPGHASWIMLPLIPPRH